MKTEMKDSRSRKSYSNNQDQSSRSMEWMRALALRQWRHGDPVKDPKRNINHAGRFLDELLEEVGASGALEEKQLHDAWAKVAGDFISQNSKPESLKNGVLVLRVVQPALRFQLEQMKGKLLQNFRAELGAGVIKKIILKV